MSDALNRKIVLVKRKTRIEDLIARFNTMAQARFYIERLGADFNDYKLENEQYQMAVSQARKILSGFGIVQVIDRAFVPNFIFGKNDMVVAVGQDGIVANTLKYLSGQALLGVNPDPKRWDGVLLPFTVSSLKTVMPEVIRNKRKVRQISMAEVRLNDGQSMLAVNDLFIGHKSHISARYKLHVGNNIEQQSSSGIIVTTGLGSSAWFKSLVTGAYMITKEVSQVRAGNIKPEFAWGSDFLYYTVREPFPSKTSKTSLVFGKITKKTGFQVESQMPENGVIFSDGIEDDFLGFNSGIKAAVGLAENKGQMVV